MKHTQPRLQLLFGINSGFMKYIIIIGDGMADYPIKSLGNKTPLMVANIPHIDKLAQLGRNGKLKTIPDNMLAGSAVANLSIMGYEPGKYFNGRGVLEAASMGIELDSSDLAMRCNFICINDGKIKNHSAGHISTKEAVQLIEILNKELGSNNIQFHAGVSYRHLLVIKNGVNDILCTPPHNVPGKPFKDVLIKPNGKKGKTTADFLNDLILKSQDILEDHPINLMRKKEGKDIANSIWPWSPGQKPVMPTLNELYGINGAVISAVDLIQGLGMYAGMDVIKVEGATGLYNTNYEGKAKAAMDALRIHDLVYLHVEATDEAGHEGDIELKIKTIEFLDNRIVKYILENTNEMNEPVTIAVLPDHPTPCELRIHVRDAVPFTIYNPQLMPDDVQKFDEVSSNKGYYKILDGTEFIKTLFGWNE